jgi:outer membrane murein-binding lipoprotein Lpp
MKSVILVVCAVILALPIIAGCDKNERVIERRETIQVQSEAVPVVVPDAPRQ